MSNKRNLPIVGMTCFEAHKQHKVSCNRKKCRHWIPFDEKQNCCIIAAEDGPHTLEKIGSIFNLTRMRICQIEKMSREKIRSIIN